MVGDLIGKTFGDLTVIDEIRENNRTYCICDCKCGTKNKRISKGEIKKRINCGCKKKTCVKDLTGQKFGRLTVLNTTAKKDNNGSIIWECECECGNTTHASSRDLRGGFVISCGCYKKEIEKEKGERLWAETKKYWIQNTNVRRLNDTIPKNNTSGVRGVTFDKRKGKWIAQIDFQKKHFYLGSFKEKEKAIEVRKRAEKELFGNFLEWYENEYKKGSQ